MEASAVSGPRRPAMAQMRTVNSQRQISRADHTRSTRKPAAWRKITRLGRSRRGRDGDQRLCLVLRRQCASSGTSAHPQPLMLPAFLTHATSHVRRISSVLEVAPGGQPSRQLPALPTTHHKSLSGPTPDWESSQDHGAPAETIGLHRWLPEIAPAPQQVGESALWLYRVLERHRFALPGILRSYTPRSSGPSCREQPEGHGDAARDR